MGLLSYLGMLTSTVIVGGEEGAAAAATAAASAATAAAEPAASAAPSVLGGLFGGGGSTFIIVIMYALVFGAAYFFWIRPQKRRERAIKEMQAAIKSGDNIVTTSGFYGKVVSVGEDCLVIEFGTNKGVRIPVNKSDIIGIKEPKLGASKEIEESK